MTSTAVLKTCEELSGCVCVPPKKSQIALRKKVEGGGKDFAADLDWHIDAFDKITAARFGVLVMVALSDWNEDNMGNFTVYPTSHFKVAEMMNEMSWMEWQRSVLNSVPLGVNPLQIHARAGDVIFANPLLAHDVAQNTTDDIRWAVLFRPQFINHKNREGLLNPDRSATASGSESGGGGSSNSIPRSIL
eukprot:TRINITY_DN2040_c0_g1_i2.p2 TRINITY_DN2040_c0_g1~~TRINITY_DN2040_c0_g1_i2.p2  ORF type:complete len:190 (+),score=45.67 TRINITY_DN2040_c0_g1_i2:1109-1678(+)